MTDEADETQDAPSTRQNDREEQQHHSPDAKTRRDRTGEADQRKFDDFAMI